MGRKPKEEKEITVPRNELLQYVLNHHEYFTCSEIAEFTGYSAATIKNVADQAKVTIITQGQRVKEYLTCNMHLTLEVQAEKLDLSMESLRGYYKQFGFKTNQAGKGVKIELEKLKAHAKRKSVLKEDGTMPLELALGPLAQQYNLEINTLDIINNTRAKVLGS